MADNQSADTPARILIVFVVIAGIITCWAVYDLVERQKLEGVEYPTGIGDRAYYRTPLGDDDFANPNLKFPGREQGFFRLNLNPVSKPDEKMRRVADEPGGLHIYVDTRKADAGQPRYYLKSDEGKYIEFGPERGAKRPPSTG